MDLRPFRPFKQSQCSVNLFFWGGKSPFPLGRRNASSLFWMFWARPSPHGTLCLTCSLWSFLIIKAMKRCKWSNANVGTHTRYCFHHCLIPPFFPQLYFSASCSWIKCFLLLNHIMHLAEALLRFSLGGLVCVKPTELKVLSAFALSHTWEAALPQSVLYSSR